MGYHLDGERSLTSIRVAAMAQLSLNRSGFTSSVSSIVELGIVQLIQSDLFVTWFGSGFVDVCHLQQWDRTSILNGELIHQGIIL